MDNEFWKTKTFLELNEEEWEALCDGCGKCCFIRYEEKHEPFYTRICCDYLDKKTAKCICYKTRFETQSDCGPVTKEDTVCISRMPKTCAYRLIYEGKSLFDWHPLVCGHNKNVPHIKNPVHEKDASGSKYEYQIQENEYDY
ncbi:MAG: YcgN family cysteine cluster protein [Treponemataceae bacterium]|nr:YcgN family cysteine cluster protein [Treponemataceae bacterium]